MFRDDRCDLNNTLKAIYNSHTDELSSYARGVEKTRPTISHETVSRRDDEVEGEIQSFSSSSLMNRDSRRNPRQELVIGANKRALDIISKSVPSLSCFRNITEYIGIAVPVI